MKKTSKIAAGIVSFLIVFVPLSDGLLNIYYRFFPPSLDSQRHAIIIGNWNTKYSYSGNGVTFSLNGVDTYFSNGKYNFHGQTTISGGTGDDVISLTSITDAAGTWDLFGKDLTITQNDIKSSPLKIVLNGKDLDPNFVEEITHKKMPDISSGMANGKSQSYKILSYNDRAIELEVINPYGENFKTTITRK
ncbi:hypothetical protein [Pantoea agglomerans]|jgi:hypothetical protein|uniref:Uncharacterized protein n=1 Tax=Enterobacter agglomerans TaxID=549 RepID=A0AAN2FAK7_ENTAG|nr:hypothetical protein [Pantoea agglomerans]AYP22235.1 hypothetical protein D0A61_04230 [Pantoea agglomerans]CAH6199160.1 hypothetical protein DAPPPG734_04390 [Pantoea agglomerans]